MSAQDVEPFDEITISYIENEEDLATRTSELEEYGFTCVCAKCVRERGATDGAAEGKGKSRKRDDDTPCAAEGKKRRAG